MCDGQRDETVWIVQVRSTCQPLTSPDGYSYVFDDEALAGEFIAGRTDAANLQVVPLTTPPLS